MSQALRNKVYGVAAALFVLLVTLGIVDQATSDEALTLVNSVLDLVPEVLGLVSTLLAFFKSLPSKVAVVEVPLAKVENVVTPLGVVLAGPGSSLKDGVPTGQQVIGERRAA